MPLVMPIYASKSSRKEKKFVKYIPVMDYEPQHIEALRESLRPSKSAKVSDDPKPKGWSSIPTRLDDGASAVLVYKWRNKPVLDPRCVAWDFKLDQLSLEYQLRVRTQDEDISLSGSPQWEWCNASCRVWIYCALHYRLGHKPQYSFDKAQEFQGFGATLYQMTKKDWMEFLGEREGASLHLWLYCKRRDSGAVPFAVKFEHWQEYKRK